nr:MAG TPA: adhesin [Caudoviricetes sp.]
MKKVIYFAVLVVVLLSACSSESDSRIKVPVTQQNTITFLCNGFTKRTENMAKTVVTRASETTSLTADGIGMTDLWLFDYVGGELKQTIHQVATDDDFGKPSVKLDYGQHIIRIVASRGNHPTLSSDIITWEKASDTFAKEVNVSVASGMGVATRLNVKITDVVPPSAATLDLELATWYKSLSVPSLFAVNDNATHYSINIKKFVGTKDASLAVYSLSPSAESWSTNVTLVAKDEDGKVLSQIVVPSVQMKMNRTTVLSGELFGKSKQMTFTLNTQWNEDYAQNF